LRGEEEWEEEKDEDSKEDLKEEVYVEAQPEASGRDDLGCVLDEHGLKFSIGDACEMLDVASGKPLARFKMIGSSVKATCRNHAYCCFWVGYSAARPSATVLASAYRWVAAGGAMNLV
jgi:hypothetical protein